MFRIILHYPKHFFLLRSRQDPAPRFQYPARRNFLRLFSYPLLLLHLFPEPKIYDIIRRGDFMDKNGVLREYNGNDEIKFD